MNRRRTMKGVVYGFGLLIGGMSCWGLTRVVTGAEFAPEPGFVPAAPPTPPPLTYDKEVKASPGRVSSLTGGLALYSIGQPTDWEQWYVELINRARANPAAEGDRLRSTTDPEIRNAYAVFGVNLDKMVADIASLGTAAPLSVSGPLTQAARWHSLDMLTNAFQSHTGSDGSNLGDRARAQGYFFTMIGENVYASAESVEYGHAGFEVDWGYGPDGMQSPPGHRLNIHQALFREVGVGVVEGVNGAVGPQLVTQDFATRSGLTPFVTGVVYYDFNGNGLYDPGEGLEGVQVTASGSDYYAVTAGSGGYSVPVPAHASGVVTFSAPGLPDHQQAFVVSTDNVKVDYVPAYAPPVVSGPNPAWLQQPNEYHFSEVGGATAYEWESSLLTPFAGQEGAEEGLAHVTATSTPGYQVVTSEVRSSGTYSFHLAHPEPEAQALEWNRSFRPGTACELVFQSRLGWATASQVARAEFSINEGRTWQAVWSQAGTGNAGETGFKSVAVALAPWAGELVQVRFVYDHKGGSYYPQTSAGVGWYLDNLTVTQAEEMIPQARSTIDGSGGRVFGFVPNQPDPHVLRVRARVGGRAYDWGPSLSVNVTVPPLTFRVHGPLRLSGGRVWMEIEVLAGEPGRFRVETAAWPGGPWQEDRSAVVTELDPGRRYEAEVAVGGGPAAFYRVVAP